MVSVTEVLSKYTDLSAIQPDVLQAATERGSKVHKICELILNNEWCPIPPDLDGYVESFRLWKGPMVYDVLATERELRSKRYGFLGHPDLVFRHGNEGAETHYLVDFKTPTAISKTWPLQLAAYKLLAEENGWQIDRIGTLRLKKDGSNAIWDDWTESCSYNVNVFLSMLNIHNWETKDARGAYNE